MAIKNYINPSNILNASFKDGVDANLNKNYATEKILGLKPALNEIWHIKNIAVSLADDADFTFDNYVPGDGGLTNGIYFDVQSEPGQLIRLPEEINILTIYDYAKAAHSEVFNIANGNTTRYATFIIDFEAINGITLDLNGGTDDEFRIRLFDDFSDLSEHYFVLDGWKEII